MTMEREAVNSVHGHTRRVAADGEKKTKEKNNGQPCNAVGCFESVCRLQHNYYVYKYAEMGVQSTVSDPPSHIRSHMIVSVCAHHHQAPLVITVIERRNRPDSGRPSGQA